MTYCLQAGVGGGGAMGSIPNMPNFSADEILSKLLEKTCCTYSTSLIFCSADYFEFDLKKAAANYSISIKKYMYYIFF